MLSGIAYIFKSFFLSFAQRRTGNPFPGRGNRRASRTDFHRNSHGARQPLSPFSGKCRSRVVNRCAAQSETTICEFLCPLDGERLADVVWDGKTVMICITDIRERGVKLEERLAANRSTNI